MEPETLGYPVRMEYATRDVKIGTAGESAPKAEQPKLAVEYVYNAPKPVEPSGANVNMIYDRGTDALAETP